MLPKLRGMLIPKASELERVLGDEEAEAMPIKETLIPNMKVAILLQLPKLTAHSLNIHNLQSVRYLVVDQCPQLSAALSPTIAPLDLLQLLENDPDYEGFDWQWGALLRTMRMDVEDNEQELTPIASPNLTQGVEEPKEQCSAGGDANISEQKCIEEFEKQSSDDDLHLAEQKETSVEEYEKQSFDDDTNIAEKKRKESIVDESSTPKNAAIIAHESYLDPIISLQGSLVSSLPKPLCENVKESKDQSDDHEIDIPKQKGVKGSSILEKATITTPTMQLDPSSSLQGSLVSSLPKALPQNVKGRFDSPTPENAKEGSSSTNSEQISLVQSSLKPIKVNQTEVDVEVVVKAFADLKVCLKIPLKDIATSESNSLHLLIALNFLSRLSFEDGTLSHELKATIQSLLQDFPSILCSFKSAFATINKFPKNETQEKEFTKLKEKMTVLEKEKQDCEVKISSLQDKKKNCVAEIIELENEFDNVTKEKNEMMEHQRKARQQLFEADYKWSILCSQFQLNKIVARNHF
ncbi:uncharacterized protein LOC129299906 isoform X2 [Prosopis cineraria]|uniref:uncharacterized protein LOC129299906 isoform X2 n=1 Tax=Prosopis cineraria TaxID=364024 RepID=UPI00240F59CB|nr:uncharacterized protein LOC129299906 isoform X2 [Prosopis cineraria]